MIINYIIFAIRLFRRDKFHSVLNIIGLSTGIACCIIILLYLQNELTYDRYHEKADRIYRMATTYIYSGKPIKWAWASPALGRKLKEEYPEIEDYVRIRPFSGLLFKFGEKTFYEDSIALADPSIFNIFTFKFIHGNPDSCLNEPGDLVLTETLARKYFGDENPMGKIMQIENKYDVKVTGVVKDMPKNSHMRLNGFVSMVSLSAIDPNIDLFKWPIMEIFGYTYLLVHKSFTREKFFEKFQAFYEKYITREVKDYEVDIEPILQKLTDVHYGPPMRFDYPIGNKAYIYAFFSIGIFILVLASINYTNMATARASIRAKEIGMKKVLGSKKRHLVFQLLCESLVASFIALIIAFGLVELIIRLSPVTQLLDLDLKHELLNNTPFLFSALSLCIIVGLISGLYPAFYLSSLLPVKALSGMLRSGKSGVLIRRTLVTFQFTISIAVVIVTLFMNNQIEFMRNKNLGFKKENVVSIDIRDDADTNKIPALLDKLSRHPNIISVTTASSKPGGVYNTGLYKFEGNSGMEGHNFYVFWVNYNYLETLGIELIKGRDFNKNHPSDKDSVIIVNEKLVEFMGWDKPLGKKIIGQIGDRTYFTGKVIGVVKNFNIHSLHNEIEPMHMRMQLETMKFLEKKWKEVSPYRPFVYSFLDEEFDRLYDADRQQNQLIIIFSIICILISCLGLLGLSSFNTSRRTKEIAIRKAHGASAARIIVMLFKEILYLVAVASVIAIPVSIILINMWLKNFAYRTSIDILIFVVAAIAALIIAFLTASYHCIKVSLNNPVDSLRYE
jgi:putative ABC transport system permease protein